MILDTEEVLEYRELHNSSVPEAVEAVWKRQLLRATRAAKTVDQLKEVIVNMLEGH